MLANCLPCLRHLFQLAPNEKISSDFLIRVTHGKINVACFLSNCGAESSNSEPNCPEWCAPLVLSIRAHEVIGGCLDCFHGRGLRSTVAVTMAGTIAY